MQTSVSLEPIVAAGMVDESLGLRVDTHPVTKQNALYSTVDRSAGDVIAAFQAAALHTQPTYLTVQVGEDAHVELSPTILQYMNHSCSPNAFFDTTRMEVRALSSLKAGDELSFFYPSSEWHMVQPFECLCGSAQCLHVIAGADSIQDDILNRYELTDYIQSKRAQRRSLHV